MPDLVCGVDFPHRKQWEQDQQAPYRWFCRHCKEYGQSDVYNPEPKDALNPDRWELLERLGQTPE